MATNYHTTTYLLASLKRRGMIPSTDEALATADFLALADEELQTYVVPLLMSVREEYLVAAKDHTITADDTTYAIPTRAIGGKLRDVAISDSSGQFHSLSRIEPERAADYGTTGGPNGYKLQNNSVVLVPGASGSSDTLRLTYFQRPNRLVATSAVGEITAINTATRVVTCSNVPTTFTTSETYDLVKGTPGFENHAIDQAVSASVTGASGTVTFSSTLPEDLAVGDFVCLAGESPVPQVPVELHPLLNQRVAFKVQEALGDPKAGLAKQVCDEMKKNVMTLLTPRSEGSARLIINRYGPGFGRGRRR